MNNCSIHEGCDIIKGQNIKDIAFKPLSPFQLDLFGKL